jgi:hypothetical protein
VLLCEKGQQEGSVLLCEKGQQEGSVLLCENNLNKLLTNVTCQQAVNNYPRKEFKYQLGSRPLFIMSFLLTLKLQ